MLKRLTSAGHHPVFARFVDLLEGIDPRRPDLLRVLTYHRVDETEARPHLYPGLAVRPVEFEQQMRYLQEHYAPISIEEALDASVQGKQLPLQAVLVTFDDAYCDFAETAWPILKQYGIPAVLFVPTAFPDCPGNAYWWDRLFAAFRFTERRDVLSTPWNEFSLAEPEQRSAAFTRLHQQIKSLPHAEAMIWVEKLESELKAPPPQPEVLSWQALRSLAEEGVALGAHTQSHPLLTRISIQEVRAEVLNSIRDLKRETGPVFPIFAYPGGDLTDEVTQVLADAGVRLGFTTRRGLNDFRRDDRLRLRRINVGGRASLALLRAQLLTRAMALFR